MKVSRLIEKLAYQLAAFGDQEVRIGGFGGYESKDIMTQPKEGYLLVRDAPTGTLPKETPHTTKDGAVKKRRKIKGGKRNPKRGKK